MPRSSRSSCSLAATSSYGWARASNSRRPVELVAEVGAAAHQGLDALAELLDADHEVIEGQHDAGETLDLRHLVEQARYGGVGADQPRAAVGQRLAPADAAGGGIVGGVLVGAGLRTAPVERIEIDAGLVMLPLGHRRLVGLVGDDH